MNGQMYQICSIVAASKKAIQDNVPIKYIPLKYENSISFSFLPQKRLLDTKKYTAPDVSLWFEHIKDRGLQDIKFLCPFHVKDRQFLGLSNTTEASLLCFFRNGSVTYFTPNWEFDSVQKQWNILYLEHEWPNPPSEKLCFENNMDSFRQVLMDIQNLAIQIECNGFASILGRALDILDGSGEYPDEKYGLELPQILDAYLQIFKVASLADVFGVMGSWNDSPLYIAQEKGLDREYEILSAELLKNIRLAILYAINEW